MLSRLKWIMSYTYGVVRGYIAWSEVRLMDLEFFKQKERFRLRFCRQHDRDNGTNNALSSYKLTRKVCLFYLELKLQENRCGCCI